jgi:hypothetical protein
LWDNDEDDADAERVEVDSPEWPGLHATTQLLATSTYLHHTDKDVRLYTVLACIEILTIVRICQYAVNMDVLCIYCLCSTWKRMKSASNV